MSYTKSLHEASETEVQRLSIKLKEKEEELIKMSHRHRTVSTNKDKMEVDLSVAKKKKSETKSSNRKNFEQEQALQSELQTVKSRYSKLGEFTQCTLSWKVGIGISFPEDGVKCIKPEDNNKVVKLDCEFKKTWS